MKQQRKTSRKHLNSFSLSAKGRAAFSQRSASISDTALFETPPRSLSRFLSDCPVIQSAIVCKAPDKPVLISSWRYRITCALPATHPELHLRLPGLKTQVFTPSRTAVRLCTG